MKIEILGPSCSKCTRTKNIVTEAAEELGVKAKIVSVTDMHQILTYAIMMTPAVVIDGEEMCVGRVPTKSEAVSWIRTKM